MEKIFRMTQAMFTKYKNHKNIVPRCISCGKHILVHEECGRVNRSSSHTINYICGNCSKKDILVYQLRINGRTPFFAQKETFKL